MPEPEEQTSIAEIFARDPLQLTRPDLTAMVKYYRAKRVKYVLGDMQAGATKKKPPSAKAKALAEAKEAAGPLDISSLL